MDLANFRVDPFFFSTGGVILVAGLILSTWMLTRTVHEKELSLKFLNDRLILLSFVSLVVGRLGAMETFWSYFQSHSEDVSTWSQMFLFFKKFIFFWHGGIDEFWTGVGFLSLFLITVFWKKENMWKWLDAFTLPTIFLLIFWNIGAFFSGWDYGTPVSDSFPFGITYNMFEVRYSVPLHPVQVYAALYFFILLIVGVRLWKKRFFPRDGTFFGVFLGLVFLGNGILEFYRGDPATLIDIGFTEARLPQVMSFSIVVMAVFFLVFHTHPLMIPRRLKRPPETAVEPLSHGDTE
ncbi:prolipoprotein diacylglyceryl transferase [Candidatus Peregrinibacteria bacterium]|nr:prolipoprotein diacylglyceryl transferase [Candidatus Peregrinibacteria bacterium]